MIFYLTISIAFLWLGKETNWLTLRLPCGALGHATGGLEPLAGSKPLPAPILPLLLPEVCSITRIYDVLGKHAYNTRWGPGGYNTKEKPSYQQMNIGGSTITLKATLPDLYKRIEELEKAADGNKQIKGSKSMVFSKGLRGSTCAFDTTRQPLCGKAWLKKHYKDVVPEPTIEIIIDGKTLSVNGDYKKGVIKDFMKLAIKEYTRR
mgnify:FL=1